ncbi:hypothetical protein [Flavimaricola marinus]|uniref:Uncharacterized protein n=1 Tax=Flavimaricola marinus TaxID=1819565 RepID=A0A238LEX4_9RHOB|nr:hypothetical protein [Flavimaricola marinus]SMY08181.1 hypothetical protein LOM8899_02331 [Flavimaricola marinus]
MFGTSKFIPAVIAAAVLAAPALAQSTESIRVNNRSGMTLYSLHASPTTNSSWENDLLGSRVLNNGQYFDLTIRNVTNCNYDVRMEFTNGQVLTDRVNVCSVGTYNINR